MPIAEVNGIQLYYEEHGKGFPLVFAHGAGGNHISWWQQVPAFSRKYRCITFDHRGWGLSLDEHDRGPAAFVDDLTALVTHLGLDDMFLVGQSMGGLTCLGFTIAHPQRVRGLVMANTFAGMRREVWLASHDDLRASAQAIWQRRREDGVKRALGREFTKTQKDRTFLYKQIRMLNENGPNRLQTDSQVQRLRALERAPDTGITSEALASISTPVLFIGGEHDEVMPVSLMAVAQGLIPGAQMHVIPGADHSAYFEMPEVFNALVLEFLASCGG
ncbi:MAG TPA: alpha/beta hydrolase [Dehalococcoidia bacterium]|nr:alpha/beta hydrolase [Dehalococcoidia bacterium]